MSAGSSLNGLPEYIDVLSLAQASTSLVGKLKLARMSRLTENLHNTQGDVAFKLRFKQDLKGACCIEGEVQATLFLICQRCIKPMQFEVGDSFTLVAIQSEDMAEKLPDHVEPVLLPENGRLLLSDVIEDELILQLPIIAKHTESDCSVKIATLASDLIDPEAKPSKQKAFAVLTALKKK